MDRARDQVLTALGRGALKGLYIPQNTLLVLFIQRRDAPDDLLKRTFAHR